MALLQLGSLGSADAFLSSKPTVTYWKTQYKKATAHATESIEMQATGVLDFGQKSSVSVARTGDLLSKVYVELVFPDLRDYYTSALAYSSAQARIMRLYRVDATTANIKVEAPTSGTFECALVSAAGQPVKAIPLDGEEHAIACTGTPMVTVTCYAFATQQLVNNFIATTTDFAGYLESNPPTATSTPSERQVLCLKWTNGVGHAVFESIEWVVGGARLDRIPNAEYLDIWSELSVPQGKRGVYNKMVGRRDGWDLVTNADVGGTRLFVPIPFTFSKATSAAVPLVALTYHSTDLNFILKNYLDLIRADVSVSQLVKNTGEAMAITDARVFCDIVYLDTLERRRFADTPTEMLFEQIQYLGDTVLSADDAGTTRKIPLDGFNHPIKEILFVYQGYDKYQRNAVTGNDYFDYDTATGADPVDAVKLVLNGQERFASRELAYFYKVQPFQHHTTVPDKKIAVYSFAIDPEDPVTPQGSCNFTRIDHAALYVTVGNGIDNYGGRIKVYGVAWNVLRIAEGMAAVVFAN